MSRNLVDRNYYISNNTVIPVKWTAPEAITFHKYTAASDVWSYGCLLYEIWTIGEDPYDDIPNFEVYYNGSTMLHTTCMIIIILGPLTNHNQNLVSLLFWTALASLMSFLTRYQHISKQATDQFPPPTALL